MVLIDAGLSLAAIDRSQRTQLSLWGALIVEAARHAHCEQVLIEDLNDGQTQLPSVSGLTQRTGHVAWRMTS